VYRSTIYFSLAFLLTILIPDEKQTKKNEQGRRTRRSFNIKQFYSTILTTFISEVKQKKKD